MTLRPQDRQRTFRNRERAWALLMDNANVVFDRMRWHYSKSMGRPVNHIGQPFSSTSRWEARGQFMGRQATDFIEETEAGVLEAVAYALDRYNPEQAKVRTYVNRVIQQAIRFEFAYWRETSSRMVADGEQWELHLIDPSWGAGDRDAGHYLHRMDGIDVNDDERLGVDPIGALDEDVVFDDAAATAAELESELSSIEMYVMRRVADGASMSEIADDLTDLYPREDETPWTKRRVQLRIDTARRKAREALL